MSLPIEMHRVRLGIIEKITETGWFGSEDFHHLNVEN